MKYYEIFFNSSQKMRTGAAGFGIRAISEDLPEEYLKAFQNEFYKAGKYKLPYPQVLEAEPEKILEAPILLSYRKIELPNGKTLYQLRRSVALAFDYSFYESGKPTRPGNFAEHTILFDERPDASVFTLLYQQPAEKSLYFRPLDYRSHFDNAEMRELELDRMPDFKADVQPIRTTYQQPVSEAAFNIFFHWIKARENNQPMVVQLGEAEKRIVMADFCRLLFDYAPDTTFACTYSNSIPNVDVTYSTEYNTHTLVPGPEDPRLYCKASETPQTEEVEKYLAGFRKTMADNPAQAQKIASWLLSGTYKFVTGTPADISNSFYTYCYNPENFTAAHLQSPELVAIIARYENQRAATAPRGLVHVRLEELVRDAIARQDDRQFVDALNLIRKIGQQGIETRTVLEQIREICCDYILGSAKRTAFVYDSVADESVFKACHIPAKFAAKADYIADPSFAPKLLKLYRYFVQQPESALLQLIARLWGKDMPTLVSVLRDANGNRDQRLDNYLTMIKEPQNNASVPRLWELLCSDTGVEAFRGRDLVREFESCLNRPEFAGIFCDILTQTDGPARQRIATLATLMQQNPAFKQLFLAQEPKNKCYKQLFRSYLPGVTRKEAPTLVREIEQEVLTPLAGSAIDLAEWKLLAELLKGHYTTGMYELALEISDKSYFQSIAYALLPTQDRKSVQKTVKDLFNKRTLQEEDFLLHLDEIADPAVKESALDAYFEVAGCSFKEARRIAEPFAEAGRKLLQKHYEKEYKSYTKRQNFKKFLAKLFGFGKKERQEKPKKNKDAIKAKRTK